MDPLTGSRYLDAIMQEHGVARECVAVLRSYHACSKLNIQRSVMLNSMGMAASERIVMTLARILDDDSETITATSFCRCIEQNPTLCAWVYTEAARGEHPRPKESVQALARKWGLHWASHPLRLKIKEVRDKQIAHRDKKHWLAATEFGPIKVTEVEDFLDDLHQMINEFRKLMENGQVVDLVSPITAFECALTLAGYEYWLSAMERGAVNRDSFFERVDEIQEVLQSSME